jgi:hypothetical protein
MTAILLHTDRTAAPTATRGSGRRTATRWYHVVTGGYETIHASNGEPLSRDFVLDGFNIEIEDTYLGLGTRDAIEAAALEQFPHRELIDFWPLSCPPATADEF